MTIWHFIAWTAFGVLIVRRWIRTSPDMMMSPEAVDAYRAKLRAMTRTELICFLIKVEMWKFVAAIFWPLIVTFIWTDGNYVFRDRK